MTDGRARLGLPSHGCAKLGKPMSVKKTSMRPTDGLKKKIASIAIAIDEMTTG
jgi:hypothetical protein